MDTKRLFIGFQLNDDWKNAIQEFIEGQDSLSVRWIPEYNWHLTLLFLGEYPADKVNELGNILSEHFKKQKPFAIPFDTFTYAPNLKRARMIWCKGATNRNFSKLADLTYKQLNDISDQENIQLAADKLDEAVPHITLSRFQNTFLPPLRIPNAHSFPMPLSCREAVLYESNLKPEGAEYSVLKVFPLGKVNN